MRKRVVIGGSIAIAFALLCVGLLGYRIFFLKVVRIPTGSMMNTILPGEELLVTKLFGEPHRGDIVMFQYPGDDARYVGRVVGLPGESIQFRDTKILINSTQIDEERVTVGAQTPSAERLAELSVEGSGPYRVYYTQRSPDGEFDISDDTLGGNQPWKIPLNNYFILGDNRDNSYDSRFRVAVPRELIWGKITMIYWSEPVHGGDARWDRVWKRVK